MRLVVGQSFVLVDDVMTAGATLCACTSVLLRAGAAWVGCVALAQVDRPTKLGVPAELVGSPQELLDV